MTLQDLYGAVSQLGFEDSLGDDSTGRFIYATNRALIEIDALRPRRKSIDINHRVPTNLLFSEPTVIDKVEQLTFVAHGAKSFYFEVSGTGSYSVVLKKQTKTGNVINDTEEVLYNSVAFSSPIFAEKKGFIQVNGAFLDKLNTEEGKYPRYTGEVELRFEGDYAYTIRNLAMYDTVYSDKVEDIPQYSKGIEYRITNLVTDFEKFDMPLIDFNGRHLVSGFMVGKDSITLPMNNPGIYKINYLHKVELVPKNADVSAASTTIINLDLEDDLAALLPNLIASYVWLDDEPEKAQYYYNLYMQRAEQIKQADIDLNPVEFQSVYGW